MSDTGEASTDPIRIARRIGEARRDAQSVLDELDATPPPEMDALYYRQATAVLDVVLRELLEAVTAATRPLDRTKPATPDEEEMAFAAAAGVPPEAFSDDAAQERDDWLAWSAIRLAQERDDLVRLSELTACDIIPGLREVVEAVRSNFTDVEGFSILRTPMEELDGVSPLRWLLSGGDVQLLVALVDDVGRDG